MLFAVGFLEAGVLAGRRLLDPSLRIDRESPPQPEAGAPAEAGRPYFQMGLGLWTFLFTTTSAFVYMEQARIVDASIGDAADRTAFFARIDLLVNAVGLILQVSVTGRILASLGAGGAAALLPAITLAGAIVLALRPTVATVQWFQVARRAADYAIARPSREVFYTALGRAELSRTKSLIDTAVYRAGDAAGAWAYGLVATIPGLSWAAPLGIVPLSMLWIAVSLGLGGACVAASPGPERPRGRAHEIRRSPLPKGAFDRDNVSRVEAASRLNPHQSSSISMVKCQRCSRRLARPDAPGPTSDPPVLPASRSTSREKMDHAEEVACGGFARAGSISTNAACCRASLRHRSPPPTAWAGSPFNRHRGRRSPATARGRRSPSSTCITTPISRRRSTRSTRSTACPTITLDVINQAGTQTDSDWAVEESLDVEWAHAIAPGAKIAVVEVSPGTTRPAVRQRHRGGPHRQPDRRGLGRLHELGLRRVLRRDVLSIPASRPPGSPSSPRAGTPAPSMARELGRRAGRRRDLAHAGVLGRVRLRDRLVAAGGGLSTLASEPTYQDAVQSTGNRSTPDVAFDGRPEYGRRDLRHPAG